MSRGANCTEVTELLVPGIPTVTQAWGLWALLGAATLLLLISLAAHLFRWTSGQNRSHPGQGRSGGSVEEVPLYGNLPYLQTGRELAKGRGTKAMHVLGGWDEGWQEEEQEVTRLLLFPIPGRLSQEPGPDQQDPAPRDPVTSTSGGALLGKMDQERQWHQHSQGECWGGGWSPAQAVLAARSSLEFALRATPLPSPGVASSPAPDPLSPWPL
ncbi:signaling threshold-regulating transmembrane adapter 1 isoform X2 [Lutra lutra]|uniref:signaling threshold-regulating transmembrane adapter 1 isoform X2 n=1 Tax=Lutra lutra TaxID=9657 RepID=UPI001FD20A5A|nr:signaling threshold-regulating transmembrane adapter 1 isoform X2 [Lutra lutra]